MMLLMVDLCHTLDGNHATVAVDTAGKFPTSMAIRIPQDELCSCSDVVRVKTFSVSEICLCKPAVMYVLTKPERFVITRYTWRTFNQLCNLAAPDTTKMDTYSSHEEIFCLH